VDAVSLLLHGLQSALATKTMTIKTACNTAEGLCAVGSVHWLKP